MDLLIAVISGVLSEEVELTLEEIERMERNADKQIELSNQLISEMKEKKKHYLELRKLLN